MMNRRELLAGTAAMTMNANAAATGRIDCQSHLFSEEFLALLDSLESALPLALLPRAVRAALTVLMPLVTLAYAATFLPAGSVVTHPLQTRDDPRGGVG